MSEIKTFDELKAAMEKSKASPQELKALTDNKALIDEFFKDGRTVPVKEKGQLDFERLIQFIDTNNASIKPDSQLRERLSEYAGRQSVEVQTNPNAGKEEPSMMEEVLGFGGRKIGMIGAIAGLVGGLVLGGGGIEGLLMGAVLAAVVGFGAPMLLEAVAPGAGATVKGKEEKGEVLGLSRQPGLPLELAQALGQADVITLEVDQGKGKPVLFTQYIGKKGMAPDNKTEIFTVEFVMFQEQGKSLRTLVPLEKPATLPIGKDKEGKVYFKDENTTDKMAKAAHAAAFPKDGQPPVPGIGAVIPLVIPGQFDPAAAAPPPGPGGPAPAPAPRLVPDISIGELGQLVPSAVSSATDAVMRGFRMQ
jgi:hypothetical protein